MGSFNFKKEKLQAGNEGRSRTLFLAKFLLFLIKIEGHFTLSKKRMRFFRTKGFLRIFGGFFLKTKGFLPKVYEIFWE